MTDFCRQPGCLHALGATNVSGVCKGHMHGPACRCAMCRAPRTAKTGKRRQRRWQIKTRLELESEGLLLPGLNLMHLRTQKGSP